MKTRLLWSAMILIAVIIFISLIILIGGSLEMTPSPEQDGKAKIAATTIIVICIIAEIAVFRSYRNERRKERNTTIYAMYRNEKLRFVPNFHGETVLWITKPEQRNMEHMTFVGGNPDEYCIFLKDLSEEEMKDLVVMSRPW